jgi:hypothetical protein
MRYCLNREELNQLIDCILDGDPISSENLQSRYDNALNWFDELYGLSYLFAQIIQRRMMNKEQCSEIIDLFYNLDTKCYFTIQECDQLYIEFMLRTVRDASLTLEDELIGVQNNFGDYRYDKALRY